MTAIADFEQRWRHRQKTTDCSVKLFFNKCVQCIRQLY